MLCKSLTDLEDHAEFNFYKMTSSDDNSDNEPAMLGEGGGKKNKEDNDGFEISGIDARRNGRYYTKQDDTYASRGDPWYCKEDGSIVVHPHGCSGWLTLCRATDCVKSAGYPNLAGCPGQCHLRSGGIPHDSGHASLPGRTQGVYTWPGWEGQVVWLQKNKQNKQNKQNRKNKKNKKNKKSKKSRKSRKNKKNKNGGGCIDGN
jgi:hypothetical protein